MSSQRRRGIPKRPDVPVVPYKPKIDGDYLSDITSTDQGIAVDAELADTERGNAQVSEQLSAGTSFYLTDMALQNWIKNIKSSSQSHQKNPEQPDEEKESDGEGKMPDTYSQAEIDAKLLAVQAEVRSQFADMRTLIVENNANVRNEISSLRTEIATQTGELKAAIAKEFGDFKAETTKEITSLQKDIGTIKLIGSVILLGVMVPLINEFLKYITHLQG